jgi:hypothetical protein
MAATAVGPSAWTMAAVVGESEAPILETSSAPGTFFLTRSNMLQPLARPSTVLTAMIRPIRDVPSRFMIIVLWLVVQATSRPATEWPAVYDWAQRKPTLISAFSGGRRLRPADRHASAACTQSPPRITRGAPASGSTTGFLHGPSAQAE